MAIRARHNITLHPKVWNILAKQAALNLTSISKEIEKLVLQAENKQEENHGRPHGTSRI